MPPLSWICKGVSLTDFAYAICLKSSWKLALSDCMSQCSSSLSLYAWLRLGLRPQVRPRLGDIPAWPLRKVPDALVQCSVDMPGGLTLWPFADEHITQEGFILHGALLHTIQSNPLLGHSHVHQGGVGACQEICAEMETLEDALEQLL